MLREIDSSVIEDAVRDLFLEANTRLPGDVLDALVSALERETSGPAKAVLRDLIENARIAREEGVAICQDTGMAYVFAEVGQDVHITGRSFREAIDRGVRRAYKDGYFRPSVASEPVYARKNTTDNTPAVVYASIVPGDRIKIMAMPKGTGSENMSALKMMVPADGAAALSRFVVETVEKAGPNPCPPIVVGVGVGGMMDGAAVLAKKALLRKIGSSNDDPRIAELEGRVLNEVNNLGIGAGGVGGRVTALAVHIETAPSHIAGMPVAVNLQCHAARHAERTI